MHNQFEAWLPGFLTPSGKSDGPLFKRDAVFGDYVIEFVRQIWRGWRESYNRQATDLAQARRNETNARAALVVFHEKARLLEAKWRDISCKGVATTAKECADDIAALIGDNSTESVTQSLCCVFIFEPDRRMH